MFSTITFSPKVVDVLIKQQKSQNKKCPEGVKLIKNDDDITDLEAEIEGPVSTPYENGTFRIKLELPEDFPKLPPKGYFQTKIFHPNISEKGEICVNTLKKEWNSNSWSLYNILEVIKCLLIVPFPESALNDEAGKLFMEDYEEYSNRAKQFTQIYAINNNATIGNTQNKESYNNNSNALYSSKLSDDKEENSVNNQFKGSQYSNFEYEQSKGVKENINEEFIMEKSNNNNIKGLVKSLNSSGNVVLGNISSNQIHQKPTKPQQKKDDKKKWLKRI